MKEYKLLQFETGDFQDQHGNTWCTAAFEGVSEPVRWVVKDTSRVEIGQSYYGEITEEKSKAGNTYRRFRKKDRPEGHEAPANAGGYVPKDQDAIKAQFAIKAAIAYHQSAEELSTIEETAKDIYLMVDRVKAVQESAQEAQSDPETPSLKEKWNKITEEKDPGPSDEDMPPSFLEQE